MTPFVNLPVRSGVEIVGARGPLARRPQLFTTNAQDAYTIFEIMGDDVRIEGIRLTGPAGREPTGNKAIVIGPKPDAPHPLSRRVLITDNEIERFTVGIEIFGFASVDDPKDYPEGRTPLQAPRDAALVRVERNYLHHFRPKRAGYGVVIGGDAYATIEANVFENAVHQIAADGRAHSGYVAKFNYVLEARDYTGQFGHHFDVHGRGNAATAAYKGGPAGRYFDVSFNTFRGEQDYGFLGRLTRAAFGLRGRPQIRAQFFHNVVAHDDFDEAIKTPDGTPTKYNLITRGTRYDQDYSNEIAAGDFDGDGRSDVFTGNGTGWWFSRAGIRPWEYLRPSNKRVGDLGFGDVDNDGRTDVVYRDGAGRLSFAKSGNAPGLTPIAGAPVPVPMRDIRFGDFDGDRLTDMFFTHGDQWHVWRGATRAWTPTGSSGKPISELLFGEFDDVRGTDVAGVNSNGWSYSSGSTQPWTPFNGRLTRSFKDAVAANLDGLGKTDILVLSDGTRWRWSREGRSPLSTVETLPQRLSRPLDQLAIGRFDGDSDRIIGFERGALRLMVWRGPVGGTGFHPRSEQNMR
ncbi:MAG TPA: VCBS repeat-containing protein [Solirubrobacteraceae bacterium]|nr:VCBS repeat-containing protein [Solirubrobacteraceae bacterium]